MRNPVPRLVALAAGVWILRAVGPEWHGAWALGAVAFFALDRLLHLLENRAWEWPFFLNISIVLGGLVNGAASVVMGWWLELEDRFPTTSRARRRMR